ncbi:hypothetical protein [Rhodoferax sp.]|uniref:ankyrin repeat domain-containing protein n=1 Tax=Rhodoferax sp. TaxID=50421 RepID=UPI00261749FB|nr:hypothetical protein [Rhodoferax sp.]MDD2926146.1 hypothetical protein [Rhodoferax sp.]
MMKPHHFLLLAGFASLAQAQVQPTIPTVVHEPTKTTTTSTVPVPVQKPITISDAVKKPAAPPKVSSVLTKPLVQEVARVPVVTPQVPAPSKVTQDFYKAFDSGNIELADMLFKQGADINCTNCGSVSPMGGAVLYGGASFDLIGWVLERGGNPNIATFRQNQDGMSAFMTFNAKLRDQMFKYRGGLLPLAQRLIDAGADVKSTTNTTKQTVLHLLSGRETAWLFPSTSDYKAIFLKYMDMLIAAGADINAKDLDGYTPVMLAANYSCGVMLLQVYQQRGADLSLRAEDGTTVRDIVYKKAIAGEKRCNPVLAYLDSGAQVVAPLSAPALTQGDVAHFVMPDKLIGNWRGVLKLSSPTITTMAATGEVTAGGEINLKAATGVNSQGRINTIQGDRVGMTLRSRAPQGQKFPNGSTETAEFKVNGSAKDGVLRGVYQATYDAGEFILCKEGMVAIPECDAPASVNDLARAVGGLIGVLKAIAQ